jgi:hypothetical protein
MLKEHFGELRNVSRKGYHLSFSASLAAGRWGGGLPVGYVIAVVAIYYSIEGLAGAVGGCRPGVVIA